jgi:tubulysin polyketide synthase-like protein
MNTLLVVREYEARGVRFELGEGGRLVVDAPKGALAPEQIEQLRAMKTAIMAALAGPPAASNLADQAEPQPDLHSGNEANETGHRTHAGERTPDLPIQREVVVEIRLIEARALALGWNSERLWNRSFWPHTRAHPRGLSSVLDSGDRLIEITGDYIVIEKQDGRQTRQCFWRTDA